MERLNYASYDDNQDKSNRSKSNKKRKWREIEAIKERYRLKQELQDIDPSFDIIDDALLDS